VRKNYQVYDSQIALANEMLTRVFRILSEEKMEKGPASQLVKVMQKLDRMSDQLNDVLTKRRDWRKERVEAGPKIASKPETNVTLDEF